jgi:hypothetical protein
MRRQEFRAKREVVDVVLFFCFEPRVVAVAFDTPCAAVSPNQTGFILIRLGSALLPTGPFHWLI